MLTGHLGFVLVRVMLSATGFLVVMGLFGALHSVWARGRPCWCAVLLGLAIAAPVLRLRRDDQGPTGMFAVLFRFVMMPMTLFAGVFFPVDSLPLAARGRSRTSSPLWHGVELSRAATLGVGTAWGVCRSTSATCWSGAVAGYLLALHRFSRTAWRNDGHPADTAPGCARRATALQRATAVTGRNVAAARHFGYWWVLLSGFFEPVLYLLSIGIGVGALVSDFTLADGRTVSYAAFVAPAMLAASAMNGALAETTINFFGKMKYMRLYDAVIATPVTPVRDRARRVDVGDCVRGSIYSVAFLGLMVAMGLTTHRLGARRVPGHVIVGFAFGGIGMAISTFMRSWQDFDYITVVQFGLFLFSGTFAPAPTPTSGTCGSWSRPHRSTTAWSWCGRSPPACSGGRCSATWRTWWDAPRSACVIASRRMVILLCK